MDEVVNVDIKRRADRHDTAQEAQGALRRTPEGAAGKPEEARRDGRVGRPPNAGAPATICAGPPGARPEGPPGHPVAETKGGSPAQDAHGPTRPKRRPRPRRSPRPRSTNGSIRIRPSPAFSTSSLKTEERLNSETARIREALAERRCATRCCRRLRDRCESDRETAQEQASGAAAHRHPAASRAGQAPSRSLEGDEDRAGAGDARRPRAAA